MELKFKSLSGSLPTYATDGASGMDLRAFIDEPVILQPMERRLIPTGLFVQIPEGYEGQVRARSGLAIKHGIGLINSIGTIDSDYRGELKIPVINFGNESFTINNGDRVAQLVIASYERVTPIIVTELDETDRGEGGFGHTGVNGEMSLRDDLEMREFNFLDERASKSKDSLGRDVKEDKCSFRTDYQRDRDRISIQKHFVG